jgi:hypothetical protein
MNGDWRKTALLVSQEWSTWHSWPSMFTGIEAGFFGENKSPLQSSSGLPSHVEFYQTSRSCRLKANLCKLAFIKCRIAILLGKTQLPLPGSAAKQSFLLPAPCDRPECCFQWLGVGRGWGDPCAQRQQNNWPKSFGPEVNNFREKRKSGQS